MKVNERGGGEKDRFTVTVLNSTHPPYRSPEVMFRGPPDCRPRDMRSVPGNLTVRFGATVTYGSDSILSSLHT